MRLNFLKRDRWISNGSNWNNTDRIHVLCKTDRVQGEFARAGSGGFIEEVDWLFEHESWTYHFYARNFNHWSKQSMTLKTGSTVRFWPTSQCSFLLQPLVWLFKNKWGRLDRHWMSCSVRIVRQFQIMCRLHIKKHV